MTKYDLISLCRLIRGKRVDLVIEAMHILKHTFPKINMVVVGSGSELKNLERLVKAAGVDVTFTGRVEDVFPYIKSAKILCHPSEQEGGSSITTLEAAACGVPTIAIKHPLGISKEYICGYMAEDFDDMVRMIKVFLKDDELRSKLSNDCIEFAKQFDWKNVMKQYEKVVE